MKYTKNDFYQYPNKLCEQYNLLYNGLNEIKSFEKTIAKIDNGLKVKISLNTIKNVLNKEIKSFNSILSELYKNQSKLVYSKDCLNNLIYSYYEIMKNNYKLIYSLNSDLFNIKCNQYNNSYDIIIYFIDSNKFVERIIFKYVSENNRFSLQYKKYECNELDFEKIKCANVSDYYDCDINSEIPRERFISIVYNKFIFILSEITKNILTLDKDL